MFLFRKNLFKVCLMLLLLFIASFAFFSANALYSVAVDQQVFSLENGAWIRVVSDEDIAEGGDVNAIRFKFDVNDAFIKQNSVSQIKAVATIENSSYVWEKAFTDLSNLTVDGVYTHYFDFANFPTSAYGSLLTLKVIASLSNGQSVVTSISRTMEYVACLGLISKVDEGVDDELFKYVGGDEIFTNLNDNQLTYGSQRIVLVSDYDGASFKSVYVNGQKQSDCSLLVSGENGVLVDTTQLDVDKENIILAITTNGDLLYIKSLTVLAPTQDITLSEKYVIKDDLTVSVLDDYEITDVLLDGQTNISFSLNNGSYTLEGLAQISGGRHNLKITTSSQAIITLPIYLFDYKFEIDSMDKFIDWLNVVYTENSWDSENCKGNIYTYAVLTKNISNSQATKSFPVNNYELNSCVSGIFDGQGYTISDISVNSLFYSMSDFVMKNVGFINVNFDDSILFYNVNSNTTELINCYFGLVSYSLFSSGKAFDKVKNVIFNFDYSYKKAPVLFADDPKEIESVFVIGENTRDSSKIMSILNDAQNVPSNCGVFSSYSDYSQWINSGNSITSFDTTYWDLSRGYPVWNTKS